MRRFFPLLVLAAAAGCGSGSHSVFLADVLAPRPMAPEEARDLVSLHQPVSAAGQKHFVLVGFVPLDSMPDLDSMVREAVATVPGATAIVDAKVEYGNWILGPVVIFWSMSYVRISGTAAGPAAPAVFR